jgi:peptidoglycan-N-acetylglucosamine deacetylase
MSAVMSIRRWLKKAVAIDALPRQQRDTVLLTFDDGPHPEGTPAVLEVLQRHSARAVFFVVGSRIHRAPEMLRRVVEAGHVLGNHSFAHPLDRQLSLFACRRDLDRCQDEIERWSGQRPTMFRPPLGSLSLPNVLAPRLAGLSSILWSVDSGDWKLRSRDDVDAAAERLLSRLSGRRLHDIVLFHDEQIWTARLLERVLPALTSRNVDLNPALPA